MNKKPTIDEINALHKRLEELKVRLFRSTTGEMYVTTPHPKRGLVTQIHTPRETEKELEWVLLHGKVKYRDSVLFKTVEHMEREAKFTQPVSVSQRVAERGEEVYLDLCDTEQRAVRIDPSGWTVTTQYPVTFVRQPQSQPLPVPVQGGSVNRDYHAAISELKEHVPKPCWWRPRGSDQS